MLVQNHGFHRASSEGTGELDWRACASAKSWVPPSKLGGDRTGESPPALQAQPCLPSPPSLLGGMTILHYSARRHRLSPPPSLLGGANDLVLRPKKMLHSVALRGRDTP